MMKMLLMVALTLCVTQIILFVISENCIRLFNKDCFRLIALAYTTANFSWLLTNCNSETLRVAWRKTLRRIWNLPSCTHSRIPLICNCLPLVNEICRRSLHFIRTCALHDSSLNRFVVEYGALFAPGQSILGQNVYFAHSAIIGLQMMLYIIRLIVVFIHLLIILLIARHILQLTCLLRHLC